MAITSLAGVISGLRPSITAAKGSGSNPQGANRLVTPWYSSGYPIAATANTSGLAGQALTSSTAALPFTNPASGNTYLANYQKQNQNVQAAYQQYTMLVDRLWENSGIDRTLTTAQTINSVTWPARDNNGSTNGEGVYLALEWSTAPGTGTPTITVSYTNSAGTSGRTGTGILTPATGTVIGQWWPIGLQAGDTGVRSVQSITFSVSWGTSGVCHLVAYRPVCVFSNTRLGMLTSYEDAVTMAMPQLWGNSVLMPVHVPGGNGNVAGGLYTFAYTQG